MLAKTALSIALAIGIGAASVGTAEAAPASHTTADAGLGTYNDFSGMFKKNAGQFVSSGGAWKNQWAYEPQTFSSNGTPSSAPGAESFIRWGDPTSWPPSSYEKFKRSNSGEWILLDGFGNSTGLLKQRVSKEVISDISCQTNRQVLPLEEPEVIGGVTYGKQHYTKAFIQPTAYCLEAWGIIEIPGGQNVNFYHRQGYWQPSGPTCGNPYFANQVCIRQFETWEDDNPGNVAVSYGPGTQPGLNLIHSRDQLLAKGKGHNYEHRNFLANNWTSYGKSYWSY